MSSDKKFTRDVLWNLSAYLIPILIAIPMLGILARILGVEKFGVFTLSLTIFGYAGIFDLGFSRAVVRNVSINKSSRVDTLEYVSTAVIAVIPIGIVLSILFYTFSDSLVDFLNVNSENVADITESIELISIALLPLLVFSVSQSYFEGLEKFKEVSLVKVKTSMLLSLLPTLLTFISPTLKNAIIGLVCARLYAFMIMLYKLVKEAKGVEFKMFVYPKLHEMLSYGKWLVITGVISPLLNTLDRFILSSIGGADKVALYTGPAEITSKFLIVPGIVARTIYPKLARGDGKELEIRLNRWFCIVLFIISLSLVICSELIIVSWLGEQYKAATVTLQILSLGLFFNGIAQLPYTSIQAKGYSKTAAYVHLAELVPYLVLLYYLIGEYSYLGAGIAWTLRMVTDAVIFTLVNRKLSKM
ncbi:hypothetical protein BCT45_05290 [Vibrio breoganii]|uniref:flippase n=1 Tax=Vibrio breoganii TaxID=553239 RepID=UPI000C858994|nr:flippase [Vibrio breoganii]PMM86848.1 hypothetical protein BCT45_05290 [Vibrio breoganii]